MAAVFPSFLHDEKSRISFAECRAFRRSQRTKESRPTSTALRTWRPPLPHVGHGLRAQPGRSVGELSSEDLIQRLITLRCRFSRVTIRLTKLFVYHPIAHQLHVSEVSGNVLNKFHVIVCSVGLDVIEGFNRITNTLKNSSIIATTTPPLHTADRHSCIQHRDNRKCFHRNSSRAIPDTTNRGW